MGILWGPASETRELGVVAEQCPCCRQTTPCTVQAVFKGNRVFFVKMTAAQETACVCAACRSSFSCEPWRYLALLPAGEAAAMPLANLLALTNPGLAERVQLKQQVSELGGDDRFATAYELLEGMRPGPLHAALLKQLLGWSRLQEEQRGCLVQQVEACAHTWQFARQVARAFPGHGCAPAFLAALFVWSAFLWAPVARTWYWGAVTLVAGCAAAALTGHMLQSRRIQRWTREVLVPEAQRANVSFGCFLAVIDDLPGSPPHVVDDLWPVKDQIDVIRGVLAADGKL